MLTTPDYLLAVLIYVAFRTSTPDKALVMNVLNLMQDKIIDLSQVALSRRDQITVSIYNRQLQEEVPHRDSGLGNGKKPSAILNIRVN
jgi:hypothetical protein